MGSTDIRWDGKSRFLSDQGSLPSGEIHAICVRFLILIGLL